MYASLKGARPSLALNVSMPSTNAPPPKTLRVKVAGKAYVATYDVADGCVQVTYKGRRSVWTELGGARAEDVARMLLKELLGVLLAMLCLNALGGAVERAARSQPQLDAPHLASPWGRIGRKTMPA
jgi:hypothetical protein